MDAVTKAIKLNIQQHFKRFQEKAQVVGCTEECPFSHECASRIKPLCSSIVGNQFDRVEIAQDDPNQLKLFDTTGK